MIVWRLGGNNQNYSVLYCVQQLCTKTSTYVNS